MPATDRPRRDPKKPQVFTIEPPPTKSSGGSWSASKVLTKSSGVINADIQAFLLTCVAGWESYSADEQRDIIGTLPQGRRIYVTNPETGKYTCPLEVDFIASDPYMKRAIVRFKNDLKDGHYSQTWQRQSRQAMKDRADGRFDKYLKQHLEDTFGDGENTSASTREHSVVNDDEAAGVGQTVPVGNLPEQGNPSVSLTSNVPQSPNREQDLPSVGNNDPDPRTTEESTKTPNMQVTDS
jgi:hypothetical protein